MQQDVQNLKIFLDLFSPVIVSIRMSVCSNLARQRLCEGYRFEIP